MPYVLWESFRAVFYTPYYAALSLGTLEEQGLDIEFGAVPAGVHIGEALRSGQAHVVWGGPMRVMLDRDEHPESDTMCFCEVVARDPFYLIGREPRPDFQLADLLRLRVGTVSEVPTPWMCLQEDLRRAGLDPAAVQRVADRSMAENVAALGEGELDVVQLFEPDTQRLTSSGAGHIWYAAAQRGLTSYTTLYATKRFLAEQPDVALGFVRGIHAAQRWVAEHSAEQLAELVADYFPGLQRAILSGAIRRYLDNEVWGKTPLLSREGFERQAASLASGGLIGRQPAYEECVDMRFVEQVLGEAKTA